MNNIDDLMTLSFLMSARPYNCLGADFQCDVIVANLFIEFEIRRGGTGDKPRSTLPVTTAAA
jgi:hypothetical protein